MQNTSTDQQAIRSYYGFVTTSCSGHATKVQQRNRLRQFHMYLLFKTLVKVKTLLNRRFASPRQMTKATVGKQKEKTLISYKDTYQMKKISPTL